MHARLGRSVYRGSRGVARRRWLWSRTARCGRTPERGKPRYGPLVGRAGRNAERLGSIGTELGCRNPPASRLARSWGGAGGSRLAGRRRRRRTQPRRFLLRDTLFDQITEYVQVVAVVGLVGHGRGPVLDSTGKMRSELPCTSSAAGTMPEACALARSPKRPGLAPRQPLAGRSDSFSLTPPTRNCRTLIEQPVTSPARATEAPRALSRSR